MMKEITRIHLAKSSYDIELAAKKQLEKYIVSLENYAQDADVMQDIEIRMTELLDERGVKSNGVIAQSDVEDLRKQLGEPHEFASEESDMALGVLEPGKTDRRFYRDDSKAVLGGVLSGIAAYFKVNPLWIRLLFIAITFISFGTALLVYLVLWAVVPKARTAADKLAMAGEPVTLKAIKRLNASEEMVKTNMTPRIIQRIFITGLGVASLVGAIIALIAVVGFVGYALFGVMPMQPEPLQSYYWVMFGLLILSGLLLATLLSLVTYAAFSRRITKRIIISSVAIIAVGLVSFSIAVATAVYSRASYEQQVVSQIKEQRVALPETFRSVKEITFNKSGERTLQASVQYVVDSGVPRYELHALPNVKANIDVSGSTATITVDAPNTDPYFPSVAQPRIVIYGPAIETIVNKDANVRYEAKTQPTLNVASEQYSSLYVTGAIEKIQATGEGLVDVSSSTVTALAAVNKPGAEVVAGSIRTLSVTQPDVCPKAYGSDMHVIVQTVSSGLIRYNDVERPAVTINGTCGTVSVGEDN